VTGQALASAYGEPAIGAYGRVMSHQVLCQKTICLRLELIRTTKSADGAGSFDGFGELRQNRRAKNGIEPEEDTQPVHEKKGRAMPYRLSSLEEAM
jgi:hypothetical protein